MRIEIREFNVMRALAILIVLCHHLPNFIINYYNLNFIGIPLDLSFINDLNRYFGIGLFIFITGQLAETHLSSANQYKDASIFLLKRYIRIMPLYILAYLIFVALFRDTIEHLNLFSVFAHLIGWQVLLSSKYCDTVVTLWYVGLVISYYYVYAVILLYGPTTKRLAALCVSVMIIWVIVKILAGFGDHRFMLYFPIFLAGVISARYAFLQRINGKFTLWALCLLIITASIYVLLVYPVTVLHIPSKPALISYPSLFAFFLLNLIMLCFIINCYYVSKLFINEKVYRIINIISYASFCIYLFHRPIWHVILQIYDPTDIAIKGLYLIIAGIPLMIFVSYYIQYGYDLTIGIKLKLKLLQIYEIK